MYPTFSLLPYFKPVGFKNPTYKMIFRQAFQVAFKACLKTLRRNRPQLSYRSAFMPQQSVHIIGFRFHQHKLADMVFPIGQDAFADAAVGEFDVFGNQAAQVFLVHGQVFDAQAFDQFGVELGKQVANRLLPALNGESEADDAVTRELLREFNARR